MSYILVHTYQFVDKFVYINVYEQIRIQYNGVQNAIFGEFSMFSMRSRVITAVFYYHYVPNYIR